MSIAQDMNENTKSVQQGTNLLKRMGFKMSPKLIAMMKDMDLIKSKEVAQVNPMDSTVKDDVNKAVDQLRTAEIQPAPNFDSIDMGGELPSQDNIKADARGTMAQDVIRRMDGGLMNLSPQARMNQGLMQFYPPVQRMANGGAITNALLNYLIRQEGFEPSQYQDTSEKAIGYGFNLTPEQREKGIVTLADGRTININKDITEEEGRAMMAERANFNFNVGMNNLMEKGVDVNTLPQGVQFALQDLTYQTGGGIFDKAPKLVQALKDNDAEKISEELKTTGRTVGGEVVESLIPRANARADMAIGKDIVNTAANIPMDELSKRKPDPNMSPEEKSYLDSVKNALSAAGSNIKDFSTTAFQEIFGSKPLAAGTLTPSQYTLGLSKGLLNQSDNQTSEQVDVEQEKPKNGSAETNEEEEKDVSQSQSQFPLREQAKAILGSGKSGVATMPKPEPKEDKDFTALQSFAKNQGIDLPNQDHLVRGIRASELRDPDRGSGLMEGEAGDAKTKATLGNVNKRNKAAISYNNEIKILQEQMNIADQVKKNADNITFLDGTEVNQASIERMGGVSEESIKQRKEKIEALSKDYKNTLVEKEYTDKIKYKDSKYPFEREKFDPKLDQENNKIKSELEKDNKVVLDDKGQVNKKETEQNNLVEDALEEINRLNKSAKTDITSSEGKNIIDEIMKKFGITSPLAQFKFFTTLAASPTVVGGVRSAADESIKVQQNQDLIRVKEIIARYQSSGRPMTDGQMWSAFMDGTGKNFDPKIPGAFNLYLKSLEAQGQKEKAERYKELGPDRAQLEEFKTFKQSVAQIYGMGSTPGGMNPYGGPILSVGLDGKIISPLD